MLIPLTLMAVNITANNTCRVAPLFKTYTITAFCIATIKSNSYNLAR